jgi:hypothetical protein
MWQVICAVDVAALLKGFEVVLEACCEPCRKSIRWNSNPMLCVIQMLVLSDQPKSQKVSTGLVAS